MKPVALVDMDGPLAAFDTKFFRTCNEQGFVLDCEEHEQAHRFATDHIRDKNHRSSARKIVNSPGWFVDLPVTPGAVEGLHLLTETFDVWIASKPLEANPTCRDEKAQWLVANFGSEWERRLIITPDKSMVRGHVLLDDAPHLEWIDRAMWHPVIFSTSWNGPGSKWGDLPHWTWGDPVDVLLGDDKPVLSAAAREILAGPDAPRWNRRPELLIPTAPDDGARTLTHDHIIGPGVKARPACPACAAEDSQIS